MHFGLAVKCILNNGFCNNYDFGGLKKIICDGSDVGSANMEKDVSYNSLIVIKKCTWHQLCMKW